MADRSSLERSVLHIIYGDTEQYMAFSEILVHDDEHFFDSNLFDAYEKVLRQHPRTVKNIDQLINNDDKVLVHRLFKLKHREN